MIRANALEETFNRAYHNASRALPVETLESPRQYGQRWRETYKCRVEPGIGQQLYYVFDHDEDYTWFMLRWQ